MAKRFRFRLATLLRLRQRELDECRRVVAERLRRMAGIQDRIDARHAAVVGAMDESRALQESERPDVVLLRRYRGYVAAMQRAKADAQAELQREQSQLHGEQRKLTEANRNVKTLEKLRQRQWQRHQDAQQRTERAESDEIALQLYRRAAQESAPGTPQAVA